MKKVFRFQARWGLWVAMAALVTLAGCRGAQPAKAASESGERQGIGREDPGRLSLVLQEPVPLAEATISKAGGTITVERPGDPLDGLTIQVPPDAYAEPVNLVVSYQPIGEDSDLGELQIISPLVSIENGGQVADGMISVRIPVEVPDDHFAMGFYYDEETGALEGLPISTLEESAVTVVTQHFSRLIVVAERFSYLETKNLDTGFRPGVDTWQFQNRGTYLNPQGICWGMSVSSLWSYLEEPRQNAGQRLWGLYDNSLGTGHETRGFWEDDAWAIMVADAVQSIQGPGAVVQVYGVVPQVEKEAREAGALLDLRLQRNQITFYSLVLAMDITKQPQLLSVSTEDDHTSHSVICYRVDGTTLYLADPNDYQKLLAGDDGSQQEPPLRTLAYHKHEKDGQDGRFDVYRSSQDLTSLLSGEYIGYTKITYYGQTALTHWQKVGQIWRQGLLQPDYPSYELLVVERDNQGTVTGTRRLDLLNPLYTTQQVFELEIIPQDGLEARVTLRPYDRLGQTATELPLSLGENTIGVYVEGLASWQDEASKQMRTDWRWLGFHWVTVIREPDDASPTPTTTTTTATPTPEATPATRTFVEDDCLCPAVAPSGGTVERYATTTSLACAYSWKTDEGEGIVRLEIPYRTNSDDPDGSRGFGRRCEEYAEWNAGKQGTTTRQVEEPRRHTWLSVVEDTKALDYGWRYGLRVVHIKETYAILRVNARGLADEAAVVALLDAAETCALQAIDAYDER
ncbi:MAG: hypothetical protein ACYC4R_02090 [Anaerolineae bacterium]